MTYSQVFLYFCLSFIIGIFINSFFNFDKIAPYLIGGGLIFGVSWIFIFWRHKKVVIGFCLLFLIFGIWHHQQAELKTIEFGPEDIAYYNNLESPIIFQGQVIKEPDIRENNIKLTVRSEYCESASRGIKGRVLVSVNRYPEYDYGDELKIVGKLKTPRIFEDFNYKDYLAKDGIYSVMYYPKIEKNSGGQASTISIIYGGILGFKNKLRESIEQNLSPPQSSILGAIILGDKSRISDEWKNKLNIAGVRHITCISGMHIIILSGILMGLGILLGLWRGQAFYFAIILLVLFIIMVGAPASAVRAGIMAGLLLFAQKIGRLRTGDRAITFAATAMLVQNPLLLKSDVGFQLSFLATLGIIYLLPIFQYWLRKIPVNFLKNILSMTLAAQIFTLPILIYNFGYMSLAAPFANILIVPLLPFILGFGFIFALAGLFCQPFAWLFSLPVWFLLTYVAKLVDWFSSFSWASLTIGNIHWLWLVAAYLILGCFTYYLTQKHRWKFLDY
jgi:competence protein ComEC